ncbi:MAG: hypothetical protein QNK42_17180, partial [Pseudodonghicola sp.]|nr:hypothetical protein [Pseudodonghicola sp.]
PSRFTSMISSGLPGSRATAARVRIENILLTVLPDPAPKWAGFQRAFGVIRPLGCPVAAVGFEYFYQEEESFKKKEGAREASCFLFA